MIKTENINTCDWVNGMLTKAGTFATGLLRNTDLIGSRLPFGCGLSLSEANLQADDLESAICDFNPIAVHRQVG